MNANRLMGAVGAFVVMFGLGGLWHQVLMGDYYAAILPTVARAEPDLVVVGLGYLITAAVMVFIFPIGYQGGSGVAEGFRFGAVVGRSTRAGRRTEHERPVCAAWVGATWLV